MSALTRQNTLFVAEDWLRIYEALENVDFRAYDFDNLVRALMNYLRSSYPEQFNDWIASSEFVTKIEILAWLSQNISFRVDLNTRENFLATAERRDSLIRLAQNIGYKVNRVRSANGLFKIKSIRTNQTITDSNGVDLRNRTVNWNDSRDEDWFERFILIMNSAFTNRTQFGFPLAQFNQGGIRTDQYVFRSSAPSTGSYRLDAISNGSALPFDIFNSKINPKNGNIEELAPNPLNSFSVIYRLDGRGFGSTNTGFFLPFKQGNITFQDQFFTNPEVLRTELIPAFNINNDDFFVQRIGASGEVLEDWTQVDTIFGESVSFNTLAGSVQNVYEIDTLVNDQVRIRFGDGTFGRLPVGNFRFWYRTANATPTTIRPRAVQNKTLTIPYTGTDNQQYQLTITYSLETTVNNGIATESNFDIRTRAGKVFYTQNRMVTGQDYNNFYLKDSSIQKVKTVNRTFAGQSRYSRLTDPTSLYQNVKHLAEDGRLYEDKVVNINEYEGNTATLSNDDLVNQYVKPLIREDDKRILYASKYNEVIFPTPLHWRETSQVAGQSRGNILFGSTVQTVGEAGSGNRVYINTDAVIRLEGPVGPTVTVDRVIENGTAADGVILKDVIPDNSVIYSVLPAWRNNFSEAEESELLDRLDIKLDFALSWNQENLSWDFIDSDDIDRVNDFDLTNQGDDTSNALDASWVILFEFRSNDPTDTWRITDRGLSLYFESAREVDFVFANTESVIDPETGRPVDDTISLLSCNESRDSLRRRGIEGPGLSSCEFDAFEFEGDGTTACFQTTVIPLELDSTVVLLDGAYQSPDIDYTITPSVGGYSVCFSDPPQTGAQVLIYYSSRFRNASLNVMQFNGNGSQEEFDLGVSDVSPNNIIAFIDGVIQNSNLDFGVSTALNGDATIVFNEVLPAGTVATVFMASGIDNSIFIKSTNTGDGVQTDFAIAASSQTTDTVLVTIDGIIQGLDCFTVIDNATFTTIQFNNPPGADTKIRLFAVANPERTSTRQYQFSGDGANKTFTLNNNEGVDNKGRNLVVAIDGVLQYGPWATTSQWSIAGQNTLNFASAPYDGADIQVFYIAGSQGILCDPNPIPVTGGVSDGGGNEVVKIPLDVESCLVSFVGENVDFTPYNVIRHDDGYVNKNGLAVSPVDEDRDGTFDDPFIFRDLVIQDGKTDLVLWRKIQEFGFSVWDPINSSTSPRGTYGSSAQGNIAEGNSFDPNSVNDGDIHYDTFTRTWLVADGITDTWVLAPDQSRFRALIGRDNLKFIWTHYAPEANRIDPSKSNIMNVYILTTGFNEAYRAWISRGAPADEEPVPETSEELRIQYQDFEEFKPISDAVIYYPARFKPLFGRAAVEELRATFKIIQTPASALSESDLKLRVLSAIETYFDVDRWDFGERFYFTELVAFVHASLAPDLQSMVIVPSENDQAFGRMFQVRAEPDELFVSAATPDDIEVVPFFTDNEIRVGTVV